MWRRFHDKNNSAPVERRTIFAHTRLPLFNIQLAVSTLYVGVATIPFRSLLVSRMELGGSPYQQTQVSFILTLLSYAVHDITFSPYKKKWLLSATLAEILCIHYSIPECIHFDGNDIVRALQKRKPLVPYLSNTNFGVTSYQSGYLDPLSLPPFLTSSKTNDDLVLDLNPTTTTDNSYFQLFCVSLKFLNYEAPFKPKNNYLNL